jgi:hypothetical protein
MITLAEVERVAAQRGLGPAQIRRDHAISHVLVAIAAANLDVGFFGGTALHRTRLSGIRASEDIDLRVHDVTVDLEVSLRRYLLQELGDHAWDQISLRSGLRTLLLNADDVTVQVQLVKREPTTPRSHGRTSRWICSTRVSRPRYG